MAQKTIKVVNLGGTAFQVESMPLSKVMGWTRGEEMASKSSKWDMWVTGSEMAFESKQVIQVRHAKVPPKRGEFWDSVLEKACKMQHARAESSMPRKALRRNDSRSKDGKFFKNTHIVLVPQRVSKDTDISLDALFKRPEEYRNAFGMTQKDHRMVHLVDWPRPGDGSGAWRRQVREICTSLERMKESGDKDPHLQGRLAKLREFLQNASEKWAKSRGQSGFYFCEATSNAGLVLESMKERVKNAKGSKDIAKIAENSLSVMPAIRDILEAEEKGHVRRTPPYNISRKTRRLIGAAIRADLAAALDADAAKIDKKVAAEMYKKVIETLDRNLFDGEGGGHQIKYARPHSSN